MSKNTRKLSYRNRPEMAHLFNSDKKNAAGIVVPMTAVNTSSVEEIADSEISKETDHQVGVTFPERKSEYASKSTVKGDGLTPLYGYRIRGTGEEPW